MFPSEDRPEARWAPRTRHLDSICPRYPPNYWLHIEGRLYRYEDIHIYIYIGVYIYILVGGWATPLKNMSSSVGVMKFPIYGKIKKCSKPQNQNIYIYMWAAHMHRFTVSSLPNGFVYQTFCETPPCLIKNPIPVGLIPLFPWFNQHLLNHY